MRIWLNGGLRDAADAVVSAFDHGLTVGDGVFETVKVVDGRPFALDRHLRRLVRSARGLGLPEPDPGEVRRAASAAPADPQPLGLLADDLHRRNFPRRARSAARRYDAGGRRRADDLAGRTPQRWSPCLVRATRRARWPVDKTTSYAENVVALGRAREHGASEALFGNTTGRLCEDTGTQRTLGRAHGQLAGLAADLRLPGRITWESVYYRRPAPARPTCPWRCWRRPRRSSSTSTTRDVQAVHRVDDRELPHAPGPVTARAMRVFAERAGEQDNP